MKRTSMTAGIAAVVLLAACSSGNGSSSSTPTVEPSAPASSSVPAPSPSTSGSVATTTSPTVPAEFDGGADYATTVTTAINTTLAAVTADPAQAADLSPSGPFHPLEVAIGQVDSTVRNYALLIPSCNAAGGLPVDYQTSPTTTTATPAELDAASIAWFDVMCTALAPVGVESNPSTPAELLAVQQTFAATISQTASALATTLPPKFDGGAEWAASVIAVLESSGATMTESLDHSNGELAALDHKDQAALEDFTTKVGQAPGFKDAYTLLATMDTQLDPSIAAAVREIPSCASVGL